MSGSCLIQYTSNKKVYKYRDNPNEIIDCLRLLNASHQAGHRSQNNELISIIEELKECGVMTQNGY